MLSTSWYRKGLFLLDGRWCGSKVQKIKQMHPKPPIDFRILFQYFSGNEKRKRFVFVVCWSRTEITPGEYGGTYTPATSLFSNRK